MIIIKTFFKYLELIFLLFFLLSGIYFYTKDFFNIDNFFITFSLGSCLVAALGFIFILKKFKGKLFLEKSFLILNLILCAFFIATFFLKSYMPTKIAAIYLLYFFIGTLFTFFSYKKNYSSKTNLTFLGFYTGILHTLAFKTLLLKQTGDMLGYLKNITFIQEGGKSLQTLYHSIFPHTVPYPFLVSRISKFFSSNLNAALYLNVFAVVISVISVYGICRKFMPKHFSLLGGILLATSPFYLVYTCQVQAEVLFGTCILLSIYFFMNGSTLNYTLAGIFLGVSGFFRPVGIILFISYIIYLVLYSKEKIYTILKIATILLVFSALINFYIKNVTTSITKSDYPKNSYGWNLFVGASESGEWNQEDGELFLEVVGDRNVYKNADDVQNFFKEKAFERYKNMGLKFFNHSFNKTYFIYTSGHIISRLNNSEESSMIHGKSFSILEIIIKFHDFVLITSALLSGIYIVLKNSNSKIQIVIIYIIGMISLLLIVEISSRYSISLRGPFSIISVYGFYNFFKDKKSLSSDD